jgi:hypothetical protein
MAQVSVTGKLPADAFALVAQHVAHAFQLANDPIDFLHRIAGDAPDQRIQIFGGRAVGRIDLAALPVRKRDVAPDELTDLTLDRVRRRLIDVSVFPVDVGRAERISPARISLPWSIPTQAQPLRDKLASWSFVAAAPAGGFILDVSQSVCGGSSSSLSLAVSIAMRISASVRVRFGLNASSS